MTRAAGRIRPPDAVALLLVALAVMLRVWAFSPYAIHHPDEQIQYLEQAYRLVFGSGLVPWEYRLGMRSWLIPLLLAGPMWLGAQLAPDGILYMVLPRLLFAALALAPLWAAWRIGAQLSRRHALMALAVTALWYESVYFSVHVLTETLATALILPAAALLLGERGPRRLVLAGVLLGFAVIVRFHYGPAAAVLALLTLRTRWREWGWLVAGGLVPLLLSSGVDLAVGQWPFAWMVENVRRNVIEDRAAQFGVYGVEAYPQMLWLAWTFAIAPILWLAAIGTRRFPVLAVVALVNLGVHLLIGHKEYRFIWLSTQLAILLAAMGTVDALARVRRGGSAAAFGLALGGWAAASLALAFGTLSNPGWRRFGGGYELVRAARLERTCGLGIVADPAATMWYPVGQAWLHADTPQYYYLDRDSARQAVLLARSAPAFDAIIAGPAQAGLPAGYRRERCAGGPDHRLCLWRRPGTCLRTPVSDRQLQQRVMLRAGR